VVARVRHVFADVVQEGGVLEQLTFGRSEPVELPGVASKSSSDSIATCRECASGQLQRRPRLCTASRRMARGSPVASCGSRRPDGVEHDALGAAPTSEIVNGVELELFHRDGEQHRAGQPRDRPSGRRVRPCAGARTPSSQRCPCASARAPRGDRELVERRGRFFVASRRRHLCEALEGAAAPDREFGAEPDDLVARAAASSSTIRACNARRSRLEIGSECTSSVVRRATPKGRLVAHCMPRVSPTITSRLPPPRSRHTRLAASGSSTTEGPIAPKMSRASSCPLITLGRSRPVSSSMRSTSSAPLSARRIALVALASTSVAPAASARSRNRRTVATAWSAALGGIDPWRLTTSPRREHLFLTHERVEVAVGVDLGDEQVERVRTEIHGCPRARWSRVKTRLGSVGAAGGTHVHLLTLPAPACGCRSAPTHECHTPVFRVGGCFADLSGGVAANGPGRDRDWRVCWLRSASCTTPRWRSGSGYGAGSTGR